MDELFSLLHKELLPKHAKDLHLYILSSLGINGKCWRTFYGIDHDPSTNLLVPHFGHIYKCFKLFRNSTHPFSLVWIESQLKPNDLINYSAS
jgi:hypothetical protein